MYFFAAMMLAGCPKVDPIPPLVAPIPPRRSLDIQYTKLRLRVDDVHDRTALAGGVVATGSTSLVRAGQNLLSDPSAHESASATSGEIGTQMAHLDVGGGALGQSLGAVLTSVAATSDRFEVITGRGKGECDLVLRTWITGVSLATLQVEQVLESCGYGHVMSANEGRVGYNVTSDTLYLDRADVKSLVRGLIGTLPGSGDLGKGMVLARDGRYVTINKGTQHNVMKGMRAFAVSYGDRKIDPETHVDLGDEIYTGDLYIFTVYDRVSRAWIVGEPSDKYNDHSRVRVGDYIVFK